LCALFFDKKTKSSKKKEKKGLFPNFPFGLFITALKYTIKENRGTESLLRSASFYIINDSVPFMDLQYLPPHQVELQRYLLVETELIFISFPPYHICSEQNAVEWSHDKLKYFWGIQS